MTNKKWSTSEVFNYGQVRVVFVRILVSDIWKPNRFSNLYENKNAKMISEVIMVSYPIRRQKISFPYFSYWNIPSCDNKGLNQREGEGNFSVGEIGDEPMK